MKNVRVNVVTQAYENYNPDHSDEFPNDVWKPKGFQTFQVDLDNDDVLFTGINVLISAIKDSIKDKSDEHWRYTYIKHEVQWTSAIELSSEVITEKLREHYELERSIANSSENN